MNAAEEGSVPWQPGSLPAGPTVRQALSQQCTGCLLSGRSGWNNGIETLRDSIWGSERNQGELVCQSLPRAVKQTASVLPSQLWLCCAFLAHPYVCPHCTCPSVRRLVPQPFQPAVPSHPLYTQGHCAACSIPVNAERFGAEKRFISSVHRV